MLLIRQLTSERCENMDNQSRPSTIRISSVRKKLIASYADAAGILYGALSVKEFVGVFNHYETEKTNEVEAVLALQRYARANHDVVEYSLYKDFITGPWLQPKHFEDDIERLDSIRTEQENKPRYIPDKDEFLKYTDAAYREPEKPYSDLKEYITKHNLCNKEEVEGDLIDLHELIQNRVRIADILEFFMEKDYPLNDIDEINSFMQYVVSAHNNTRMFENNGHTPDELVKMTGSSRAKEPIVHRAKKVGRNDPCPCGSGKKYKKCCGPTQQSGTAQLTHTECKLFYETWYKLLDYVNRKHKAVNYVFSLKYPNNHDETLLHKIREQLWGDPEVINEFISNSDSLTEEEVALLKSWKKYYIKGQFVVAKYTPLYAVLMNVDTIEDSELYAVKGMTTSVSEAINRRLPVMLETVLLPFGDKIIYDSFMASYNVEYGSGITDMLVREYTELENSHGIITSLQ